MASVGLHVFALLAPFPSHSPPIKPKAPQPKTVKLASLPPIGKTKPLSVPRVSVKPLLKSRLSVLPQKGLTVRRPITQRQAAAATPQDAKRSVSERSSQKADPSTGKSSQSDSSNPLKDFPNHPDATSGCLGLQSCFSVDKPFSEIVQFFDERLKKQFKVQAATSEPERKVYPFVAKDNVTRYLSVLSDGKSTEYIIDTQPRTQAELRNAVQIPADFTENILAKLPTNADAGSSEDVSPEQFSAPTDFFAQLGGVGADGFDVNPEKNSEIDSMKLVSSQKPLQAYNASFSAPLSQAGYQATAIATGYGGGLLYEIKKGTFKPFYLNLVPTKNGTDTVVVVWLSNPS
jgi:hypothetical protein